MQPAPLPLDESARLAELHGLRILDTPPEERFDRITRLASHLFGVPIALVSLVDFNRQWFKSCQGLTVSETPRDVSFCAHAILGDQALVIEDARQDRRFADNPLVVGEPYVRFYAGELLRGPHGRAVGTLCIIDREPRRMNPRDLQSLRDLAAWVESELNATQLASLVENLADGMIAFDELGMIEFVNPAAEKIFGCAAQDVVGQSIETILPGACPAVDGSPVCENLPRAVAGEAGDSRELRAHRRDGVSFPIELSIGEVHLGDRVRFIGIVHDLTTRKQAEERLRLQAAALEAAANGIVITDRQGVIRWVNPAFTGLSGYTAGEAVGQDTRLLKSGKQDPAYYRKLWRTVTSGRVWQGELINRRKNGRHYTEEMTITPVRDDRGEIDHFVSIKQDVSARKRAEEKLRDALSQLEIQYDAADRARSETLAILDATSEAMVLVSPDDRFLMLNRRFEEFFGTSSAEVVGRSFAELLPRVERAFEDAGDLISRLAHSGNDVENQFTEVVVQRWPRRRELELFSTPVRKALGEHLGRLHVFRDVTRERELDRLKSEFVSLVSHELRTPLTSIGGYVEMLLDGDAGDLNEEQADFLRIVQRNTDRLSALIADLLDVSRIEAGRIELKLARLELAPLLQGVVEALRPQLEGKRQSIGVESIEPLPPVRGDADRVTQVLMNLLSNAHKYTPEGGSIHITACLESEMVRVDIRDSGVGLTPEEQKKLFTKFFRAENPATQEVGGTGLGLWITRSLVEMHGGQIAVTSTPRAGSTFSFTLPADDPGEGARR